MIGNLGAFFLLVVVLLKVMLVVARYQKIGRVDLAHWLDF
jgi:hypothetical protein